MPAQVLMSAVPKLSSPETGRVALSWKRSDSVMISVLIAAAIVTHLWSLGYPDEPVFDEIQFVGQAMAFIRGEQFTCVHPNLGPLLIALAIKVLGFHSWAWRTPSALLGIALVPITFLLAREMFSSRVAGVLAGAFVLFDGMFLVHSRLGMLEIFYVTFTAASYLLLFILLRTRDSSAMRRMIVYLAIASGSAMATKLLLPEIGFLLVVGFLLYDLFSRGSRPGTAGIILVLGSVSGIVYLATFIPDYWLGWWGGARALVHYYGEVIFQLRSFGATTNPFVSPWWSWPLMLRAPLYWQTRTDAGLIATIWGGGNPVLWWSSLAALLLTAWKAIRHPALSSAFLLLGYVAYMLALGLPTHPFYLYIYISPLYLQYIAFAAILAECWKGAGDPVEHLILIASLAPASLVGLGTGLGILVLSVAIAIYVVVAWRSDLAGKFVCALIITAALVAFVYFLPVWVGTPIDPASYENRIWLNSSGLVKWM